MVSDENIFADPFKLVFVAHNFVDGYVVSKKTLIYHYKRYFASNLVPFRVFVPLHNISKMMSLGSNLLLRADVTEYGGQRNYGAIVLKSNEN